MWRFVSLIPKSLLLAETDRPELVEINDAKVVYQIIARRGFPLVHGHLGGCVVSGVVVLLPTSVLACEISSISDHGSVQIG